MRPKSLNRSTGSRPEAELCAVDPEAPMTMRSAVQGPR